MAVQGMKFEERPKSYVTGLQAPSPFGSNLLQLVFADGTVTLRAEETGCQGGSVLLESCGSASSTEGYPFVGRTSAWSTTKHKDLID
ncbi:unnamed protein product [Brugia pahangi]|uniref:Ricin B-type lectin domain-containing protein n=1 Tax=Brugia pahangi TaxID=6280 RepID=A0A0N4T4E1_BRUPA|nr:unnamed protein product [Brugia pahangi]